MGGTIIPYKVTQSKQEQKQSDQLCSLSGGHACGGDAVCVGGSGGPHSSGTCHPGGRVQESRLGGDGQGVGWELPARIWVRLNRAEPGTRFSVHVTQTQSTLQKFPLHIPMPRPRSTRGCGCVCGVPCWGEKGFIRPGPHTITLLWSHLSQYSKEMWSPGPQCCACPLTCKAGVPSGCLLWGSHGCQLVPVFMHTNPGGALPRPGSKLGIMLFPGPG